MLFTFIISQTLIELPGNHQEYCEVSPEFEVLAPWEHIR